MMHLLLSISLHLLQLVLCCSTNSGRLSVLFLHGYCEGEGYSTKDLGLEVAARLAAVDVGACSESPVELTPIAAVSMQLATLSVKLSAARLLLVIVFSRQIY